MSFLDNLENSWNAIWGNTDAPAEPAGALIAEDTPGYAQAYEERMEQARALEAKIFQKSFGGGGDEDGEYPGKAIDQAIVANLRATPPPSPGALRLYEDRKNTLDLAKKQGVNYLGLLEGAAAGTAPSQAQDTLREGTARTVASAYGQAASAPVGGAQGAALMNQAGWQAASANQAGARTAAQLRAQEMADARAQLGTGIGQVGGLYAGQSGLDLSRAQSNQASASGAAGRAADMAQFNAAQGASTLKAGIGAAGTAVSSDILAKEDIEPLVGSSGARRDAMYFRSALPQAMVLSDERSKERIQSLEAQLAQARDGSKTLGLGEAIGSKGDVAADEIYSTQVDYPDVGQPRPGGAAPTDLVFSSEDGGNFRTPDEQLRYSRGLGYSALASPGGSRDALGPVDPFKYRYKPEFASATGEDTEPRAGVMAQDLERSPNPALRSAVVPTANGLAIDGSRGLSASLAMNAGLDKRLRAIEEGLGRRVEYPSIGLGR